MRADPDDPLTGAPDPGRDTDEGRGLMSAPARPPLHAHDFPTGGHPEERLRFLVRYAILAPSGHNTQPWLFRAHGDALDLLADRTRALPVVDPHDRELTMSCGAALHHLTVAASAFGHPAAVATFPDPGDLDLLATVRLGGHRTPTADEAALFDAIPHRRTNRHRFDDRPLPDDVVDALVTAVAEEGAWLAPLLADDVRQAAAGLVAEGDAAQFGDPSFRRELAAWHHPRRAGDGLTVPAALLPMAHFVMRTFDVGDHTAARDRQLAEGSPVLAVLGTEADDPAAWLAAGSALSRALLTAQTLGVSASFLNQPIEVPALRPRLAELAGGTGHPQLLLRFGYGPDVAAAPRRPLSDVLL
jgi:hypothetical protein